MLPLGCKIHTHRSIILYSKINCSYENKYYMKTILHYYTVYFLIQIRALNVWQICNFSEYQFNCGICLSDVSLLKLSYSSVLSGTSEHYLRGPCRSPGRTLWSDVSDHVTTKSHNSCQWCCSCSVHATFWKPLSSVCTLNLTHVT